MNKWRASRDTVAHSLKFGEVKILKGTPVWTRTDSTTGDWMDFNLSDNTEFTAEMGKFTSGFARDDSPGLD